MAVHRQTSKMVLYLVWTLLGFGLSAPPIDLDPEAYGFDDTWDLNYDYDEELCSVSNLSFLLTEVETLAPPPAVTPPPAVVPPEDYVEEVTLPPRPTKSPVPSTLDLHGPGLFGPDTGLVMNLAASSELTQIPPLPKETTHFYARFNKITELQDLMLADNNIQVLPELPASLKHIDVRNNQLRSSSMHAEAFKEMKELQFLYLSNNKLDYIPVPLPDSLRSLHLQNNNIQSISQDDFCNIHDKNYIRKALEDIRLDGNPVDINFYPQAYICLPRLPVGTPV
ncbi:hypothetical protein PO909_020505 [Leuciscus waleckii]